MVQWLGFYPSKVEVGVRFAVIAKPPVFLPSLFSSFPPFSPFPLPPHKTIFIGKVIFFLSTRQDQLPVHFLDFWDLWVHVLDGLC